MPLIRRVCPGNDERIPEGTALRVYLFLLRQSEPVGLSDVRLGANLSTSSLASYHLDKLVTAGLARREGSGWVADKLTINGFVRLRNHLVSTSLFMAGFLAASLIMVFFGPWQSRYQQVVMSAGVICVALIASLLRAAKSANWLRVKAGDIDADRPKDSGLRGSVTKRTGLDSPVDNRRK